MKSMRETLILGGWFGVMGVLTALAQTNQAEAVPDMTATGVTAIVTNVAVPAVTAIEAATNQPAPATPDVAITNEPTAAIPAPAPVAPTGVTHAVSASNTVALPVPAAVEVAAVPETTGCGFCTYEPAGKVKVGTRYLNISLKDTTRGTREGPGVYRDTFMGSIMKIEEEGDNTPDRLFAQWRPLSIPVWVGVSYDHLSAKTLDSNGGDGSVELAGFVPYVQAAWANRTRFTPYAEVGLALYQADFKENEWSDGGRRTVKVSDPQGVELAAGTAVRLWKHWSADFYVRQMTIDDVTGGYYIDGGKDGDVIFTLSYTAYGLGVTYEF